MTCTTPLVHCTSGITILAGVTLLAPFTVNTPLMKVPNTTGAPPADNTVVLSGSSGVNFPPCTPPMAWLSNTARTVALGSLRMSMGWLSGTFSNTPKSLKAWSVGANTVNGPALESTPTKSAYFTASTKNVSSGFTNTLPASKACAEATIFAPVPSSTLSMG